MPISTAADPALSPLADRFVRTRALTAAIAAPLSDADATIQSMPDASPAKWHLAHTSWFFETFVLRDHVPGYRLFDDRWGFLFNSYYDAEGARQARAARGMLSRPTLDAVIAYRAAVDAAVRDALPNLSPAAAALVRLGCEHEAQHQELLLTDILHHFSVNPLEPAVWPPASAGAPRPPAAVPAPVRWRESGERIVAIGTDGAAGADGFAFDCETPRHRVLLNAHALADRTVTNAEWLGFIADGGYRDPRLWLSDGWAWVQANAIAAPLYWQRARDGDGWTRFGLDGRRPSRMSAFSKPTPMRAGPARACRSRPNGRPRPRATIPTAATCSTPPVRWRRVRRVRVRVRAGSAMSGNGPAAPIVPIRASIRPGARWANITASS